MAVIGPCRLTVIIGFSVPNGAFSVLPARTGGTELYAWSATSDPFTKTYF